jgi:hypothetical protein
VGVTVEPGVLLPVGVDVGVLVEVTDGVILVAGGVREAVEDGPAVPFCPGLGKAETGPS